MATRRTLKVAQSLVGFKHDEICLRLVDNEYAAPSTSPLGGSAIVFIPDLTHYPGADKWAVPLRAVGWLEYPEPYTTGSVPAELAAKLWALVANPLMTLGIYSCSFCREYEIGQNSTGVIWSRELFIPGDAEVFVAPGGVIHYVESHLYLPPGRFIDAVTCPDPGSAAYSAAILKSNAGA